MNSFQTDLFSDHSINNIKVQLMPFAIPILQTLYTKATNLNIEEIYNLFANKHKDLIRATIEGLKSDLLIKNIEPYNSASEQRYEITKYGEAFLFAFYTTGFKS